MRSKSSVQADGDRDRAVLLHRKASDWTGTTGHRRAGVGLTATLGSGGAVDLRDKTGQVRATYSGLRDSDATGQPLPAQMAVLDQGAAIVIEVHATGASYPLTVDPTWSAVPPELTAPSPGAADVIGYSVAISGTTAIVGAFTETVGSNEGQGSANIFTSNGATWSFYQQLADPNDDQNDWFGYSVAISGTTAVVGAPYTPAASAFGEAYVFTDVGGTWSKTTDLTASDEADGDEFGFSVAISGNTVVVGAPEHEVDGTLNRALFTSSRGAAIVGRFPQSFLCLQRKHRPTHASAVRWRSRAAICSWVPLA